MMNNMNILSRFSFVPALLLISLLLASCKSSDYQDVFRRCAPECTETQSPVALEEIERALVQTVSTISVNQDNLSGRWVLLSTNRYQVDEADKKSVSDLLFTKSLVLTDFGNQVQISDCYNTELYSLNAEGFTIPQDSIFFNSLYFENKASINVMRSSNVLLNANWVFERPDGVESPVTATMYKVSNDQSNNPNLGEIENGDLIHCYSFLHLFTTGEQLFEGQWIPGESEIKEMLLTLDPANGDNNLALGSDRTNENTEYRIIFNRDIPGQEYECFGETDMQNTSTDYLSYNGFFSIDTFDSECITSGGQVLGQKGFSFTAL